jgi:hypothetical protein
MNLLVSSKLLNCTLTSLIEHTVAVTGAPRMQDTKTVLEAAGVGNISLHTLLGKPPL